MLPYLLRRIMQAVPTLLGVALVAFLSMRLIPGDPARLVAGPEASEEVVASIRRSLGLDVPLPQQLLQFFGGLLRLDLGTSLRSGEPVWDILLRRLPATVELAATGILLAALMGLTLGVVAAVRKNTWFDTASMVAAVAGISMPSFWLGLMMIWLFAVNYRWLPTSGAGTLAHLVMPATTIGIQSAAMVARMVRSSVIEALQEDYIRTARAKGLREGTVLLRHALRNSLIPVITVLGLQFGYLLAGSVVTETVFNWPGMGLLLVLAIAQRDYPVVQGALLIFAVFFVLSSLLVDVAYALVDPRIRYG